MDFADLQHPIVAAIYKTYEEANAKEEKRGYLGASIIGAKCERYLWYTFRECCEEKFDGRMLRLFDRGDCEEVRMIKDLQAIGCIVNPFQPLPLPGLQHTVIKQTQWEILALGDHFSGHPDALVTYPISGEREWCVGEFKTHKHTSFKATEQFGVQQAQPKHYAQIQVYMREMGLKKALYLAVNKDNEELYVEVVEYNKDDAEALMLKAKRIVTATEPPPRYSEDRNTFECRYCCANSICWGNPNLAKPEDALPWKSCRQCNACEPNILEPGAHWYCMGTKIERDEPCEHYTLIPEILSNGS